MRREDCIVNCIGPDCEGCSDFNSGIVTQTREYLVEFKYYQYNSGAADNGTFMGTKKCENLNDAKDFKKKLQEALKAQENREFDTPIYEWAQDLVCDRTVCGGYLVNAPITIKRIEKKITIIE
jgi:hypothetical protein